MGWYEALKDAISLAQKADNLALMRQLLDAQREMLDMQAEINTLHGKLLELEREKRDTEDLYFKDQAYWRKRDGIEDGPFCPRCFDADRKIIRLRRVNGYVPSCPNCQNYFGDSGPAFA